MGPKQPNARCSMRLLNEGQGVVETYSTKSGVKPCISLVKLRTAAPSTFPHIYLVQFLGSDPDYGEGNLCSRLNCQRIPVDQLHERVRIIYDILAPHLTMVHSFPMHFEDILTTAPPGTTREGTVQCMSKVRPEMPISLLLAVELNPTIRFRAHQGLWRQWRVELTGLILRRRWHDRLEGEVNIAGILH